jgi:hypothetical protein
MKNRSIWSGISLPTRLILVITSLLLWTPETSPSEIEPEKKYNRDDAFWYIGFGAGVGVEIFDFFLHRYTPAVIGPGDVFWGYTIAVRAGIVTCPYLLGGFEYHLVSDAGDVFHYYGGGLTFFPFEDLGLYFKGSYNYGSFDYRNLTYSWPAAGKGHGPGFRIGAGYGLQVGESFTPELEISYNCMFSDRGILSSISLMLFCSWY